MSAESPQEKTIKPLLILVNGLMATGKTTLAKNISREFKIPYFSKDDFKSILVDELGTGDRPWLIKLGKASAETFRYVLVQMISAGKSVVIDQLFFSEIISPFVNNLKSRYSFEVIQIYCKCSSEIALERFTNRANLPERNPGFRDELMVEEVRERYKKGHTPADVGGLLLEYKSTDLSTVKYQEERIFSVIREHLEGEKK